MTKQLLRKQFGEKRELLPEEEIDLLTAKIKSNFFELAARFSLEVIHTFLPIKGKKEVNTWQFIKDFSFRYPAARIIISKSEFKDHSMSHFLYRESVNIEENEYGIPEPTDAKAYNGKFDIILVPLLAFDRKGHRVGYGKGFYDRFLSEHENAIKIGLSFFGPTDAVFDANGNDVQLDYCITPDEIYSFGD